jgi:hypothetical protein
MGAIGGTHFVPGTGGANVSRMGAAHMLEVSTAALAAATSAVG